MALKRKRSTASLSPSSSTTSSCPPSATPSPNSTVPAFFTLAKPHPSPSECKSLLHSRTMKRHRDNRPSDTIVHASTLHKLYSAQRRAHESPPPPPPAMSNEAEDVDMQVDDDDDEKELPGQNCTLYAFWGRSRAGQSVAEVDMCDSDTAMDGGRGLS